MKPITVTVAKINDIDWINSKYKEVDFVASNFENEFIVIAKVENENAGLGRLVKLDKNNIELGGIYVFKDYQGIGVAGSVVNFLIKNNPYKSSTIWCLPFENLKTFYSKFGFKPILENELDIPDDIVKKVEWCNSNANYDKKVLVLYK